MARLRIFSTHPLHPEVAESLAEIGNFTIASAPTPTAIVNESAGAELIVVRAPIPPEIIGRETGLKALIRHGAGLDMIPVDIATKAGVLVANVPGANALTVAEHAIWSAVALLRRFPEVSRDLRETGWTAARAHSDSGRELSGRTLGIVGLGSVGREIARIGARGFGMKVLTHTRSPEKLPGGVVPVALDTLLEEADVVTLCCPLTEATRGMIGPAAIARMKSGAILVNVARGPVVDEAALAEALKSGSLGGAAIDVFSEQPLPRDHPFMQLSNVILTPHMAGITAESMLRMGQGVVAETRRIAAGDLPERLVNPASVARYRERFG